MQRQLRFTDEADRQLKELETNPAKKSLLKQVQKTLGFLEINIRHPGLNTHEYESLPGANGCPAPISFRGQRQLESVSDWRG